MTDEEFSSTLTPPTSMEDKWERLISNLPNLESTGMFVYKML